MRVHTLDQSLSGFQFVYATWFEEDTCMQAFAWFPGAFADRAIVALESLLAGVQWIAPADCRKLRRQLLHEGDPEEHVSATSSLRGGVFRDFANGFLWSKPESGSWSTRSGDLARQQNPDACLVLESKSSGLFGELVVETGVEFSPEELHEWAVSNLEPDLGGPEPRTEIVEIDGLEYHTTWLRTDHGGLPVSWMVTGFMRGDRAVQLFLWGTYENVAQNLRVATDARDGLRLVDGGLEATRATATTYIDERLGFELTFPRGTELSEQTVDSVGAISSALELTKDGDSVGVFVVWLPYFQEEDGSVEDLLFDQLKQAQFGKIPRRFAKSNVRRELSSLGGRPATRLIVEHRGATIDARYLLHGSRLVAVVADDPDGAFGDLTKILSLRP